MRSARVVLVFALAACRSLLGVEDPSLIDADSSLPHLAFAFPQTSADEASGMVAVAVQLDAPATTTVTVDCAVIGGTATPGADFTVATSKLEIPAGETTKTFEVAIVPDADEAELDETVELGLFSPAGATLGTQNTHTIHISSIILPRVQFAMASTASPEDTPSMVMLTLDKDLASDATVVVGVTGATPGVDYTIADGTVVSLPAHAQTVAIPIGELEDALDEDDETLALGLSGASLNVVIGAAASATHVILDNDAAPAVGFTVLSSSSNESVTSVLLDVALSAASGKTVTVDFAPAGGSAGVTDAGLNPGTLTFAPGETSKQIAVSIVNDTLDENDETFTIMLANPVNATIANGSHTLTIVDDDNPPEVAFTTGASNVNESGTTMVTVSLSAVSGKPITVAVAPSGTAASPADFMIATSSPLTFSPGDLTKTITINIANDMIDEFDETVVLTLGSPQNAAIGLTATHTLTILDDDAVSVVTFDASQINRSQNEGDSGSSQFSYDLVLDRPSGKPITVPINVTGAATTPGDFSVVTVLPIAFQPGETRRTLSYTVVRDTVTEPDEDIVFTINANPTNATRGAPNVRSHLIKNDD